MSKTKQYWEYRGETIKDRDDHYERLCADIADNTYSIVFLNKDSNGMKASFTENEFIIPDDVNIQPRLNRQQFMSKLLQYIAKKQVLKIDIIGGGVFTGSTSTNSSYEDSILQQLLQKLNDSNLLYNSTNKKGVMVWVNNLTCLGGGTNSISKTLAQYEGTFMLSHNKNDEENKSSPSVYNLHGFNVTTQANRNTVSGVIQDKIKEIIKESQQSLDQKQDKDNVDKNNVESHKLPLQDGPNQQDDRSGSSKNTGRQNQRDYALISSYIRSGFRADWNEQNDINEEKNALLQAIQRQTLEYSRGKYSHVIRFRKKTARENLVCRYARAYLDNNKPETEKLKNLETIAQDICKEGRRTGRCHC